MLTNLSIKEHAIAVGFDLVGVTFPREFTENRAHFEEWISAGNANPLDYMQRYHDVRFNPANLLDECRTVVVCAINYKNQYSMGERDECQPMIASYAMATDYHKVVRKQLKALLSTLKRDNPELEGRCCVDTAPLLEKQLAREAGLGWIGRQSLLISPQFGSFMVLGVLLLDREVDKYDEPYEGVGCGECRRCVESCPNGAILQNRMIDTRRCISSLTVECESSDGVPLHGWIFGCDECQRACPYNRMTPLARNVAIQPIFAPISAAAWSEMSPEEFAQSLGKTPMKRGGLERLQRNVARGLRQR